MITEIFLILGGFILWYRFNRIEKIMREMLKEIKKLNRENQDD